ncbi:MAG: heme lyase CcmF/NrfE family subunit [Gemmatimonas sp.]
MTGEIGQFALILALALALAQGTVPLIGAARASRPLMAIGSSAAVGQFVFVALAFAALIWASVADDFSVLAVVENSHTTKPLLYKIAGAWGNHEGSMVLWIFILALFGATVAAFGARLPSALKARVLAVQGLVGVAFLTFILFTSNPFLRVIPPPLEGQGLNPLLQDPGLAFHPPFLYLGYVGFSVVYAFAVAAMLEGRVDPAWARWVRPWTLAAWSALTVGIALGSWWAYYELGWGGFWFWDPVENASLMPWLAGTALLHSAIVVEKRDALKSWTVLLAVLTFTLSLMGTFLVRSGVLTSVHAFANDPARGVFVLLILAAASGGALALYAARASAFERAGSFAPISREGALVLNNLLLTAACATVVMGTLYPLLLDALGGAKISVGAPYFNSTVLPLLTPVAVAAAVAPLMSWKRSDLAVALRKLWAAALAALVMAIAVFALHGGPWPAAVGLAVGIWLLVGTLVELAERARLFRIPVGDSLRRLGGLPRAAWGMALAHGGFAVVILGIAASQGWHEEKILLMAPGDSTTIGSRTVAFKDVTPEQGPNWRADHARMEIRDSRGGLIAEATPERRWYPVEGQATTEAAIHTSGVGDVYVVIGEPEGQANHQPGQPVDPKTRWVVRLYVNPLQPWIWFGAIVMALGGVLSLTDRRLRVGAPARKAVPGAHPAAAE